MVTHNIKVNGKWYKAGSVLPASSIPAEKNNYIEIHTDNEAISVMEKYTKTDINRMPVAELKELCEKEGIVTEDMSGSEMKKLLIERFQL